MRPLRLALTAAACVALPAAVAAAFAGYLWDRIVGREADLFAGIEEEIQSWIPAATREDRR